MKTICRNALSPSHLHAQPFPPVDRNYYNFGHFYLCKQVQRKKQAFSNKLLLNIISAKIYQKGLSKEMCMFCWRTVTNIKYILVWSSDVSRRLSEFIIASSHSSSSTSLLTSQCWLYYSVFALSTRFLLDKQNPI